MVVVYDIEDSSATPIYDSILGTCIFKKEEKEKKKKNDSPLNFGPENSFRVGGGGLEREGGG